MVVLYVLAVWGIFFAVLCCCAASKNDALLCASMLSCAPASRTCIVFASVKHTPYVCTMYFMLPINSSWHPKLLR